MKTAAFAILLLAALPAIAAEGLNIGWTNNFLTISGRGLPGDYIRINYLEAFCRSGSTHRDWKQTVIPHKTELVAVVEPGRRLKLLSKVEPSVEVTHDIIATADEIEFRLEARNNGTEFVDVQWFQPCIRLDRFTGGNQSNYVAKSFIYTSRGLTMLDQAQHTEEARYRGGQVYVPKGVNTNDVNPRPLSADVPVNALIGCFSADNQYLFANAWNHTQELFQGVIVCLHNDPRIGGLRPGESRKLHGKIYLLKNDPAALLKRYQKDFPPSASSRD
jgi:hypothetical protein